MGAGKGGSQTTTTQIPAWLEDAARQNIGRADVLSTIGYTPYYGPDVAALTPNQIAAMEGTNQAASAFGMPTTSPTAGMPPAQDFGGVSGYSSAAGFEQALEELRTRRPGQYEALTAPFINPVTGEAPSAPFGPLIGGTPSAGGQLGRVGGGVLDLLTGGMGTGAGGSPAPSAGGGGGAGLLGGYTGLRDMINGGGPGASGDTFQGGGRISSGLNAIGVQPRAAGAFGASSGMGARK